MAIDSRMFIPLRPLENRCFYSQSNFTPALFWIRFSFWGRKKQFQKIWKSKKDYEKSTLITPAANEEDGFCIPLLHLFSCDPDKPLPMFGPAMERHSARKQPLLHRYNVWPFHEICGKIKKLIFYNISFLTMSYI